MPSSHLEGKLISVGTHKIRKSASGVTALEEFQWDTTLNNSINFISGQLIKLTYRHAPMNATLESVFLDFRLTNNGVAPVSVLPLWTCIKEMRVYINNKRVIDWNREEQCRTAWNTTLLTSFDTNQHRRNRYYTATGQGTVLDGGGDFQPVTVPAGDSHQFHLNFKDIWEGFSASLPLNKVNLIEVEMNLSSRGDFVCNPPTAVGDLQIDNLLVYSRHKRYMTTPPPQSMGAFTIRHTDVDVFQLTPSQHPFANPSQEFDINVSVDFPRRKYIQRLILFSRDPADVDAYRRVDSSWVRSMELLRNGITLQGTEFHLDTERKIFKEVTEYLQRHHSMTPPTHPDNAGHGQSFYLNFVDCSTVTHTQNSSASQETKNCEVNGLDNFSNLVLRIRSNTNVLSATANVVLLLEYNRFDKLQANGQVVKVLEHLA
jgi:hypothetical protein